MSKNTDSEALERTAQIAQRLIQFDTTNYGSGKSKGEREAAEYVTEILHSLGLEPVVIESAPRRTNVVAKVAGNNPDLPALIIHGHLDVVPAIAEDWQVDPFAGLIKDGYLWGRGAVDMKDMDAMILSALEELLQNGERPNRDLIIAFFADEEAAGVYGAQYLVANNPELFSGATEAISEVGGYSVQIADKRAYLVQTGEKSLIWLTLRAKGTAGHGSQINDDNSITKLAQALLRITDTKWPIELTATTKQLLAEVAKLHGLPTDSDPSKLADLTGNAKAFVAATLQNTVNPSGLTAGYKHNVIPGSAEAWLDVRTLPGQEEQVIETLRKLAGPDVEIVFEHRDIGLETEFSGPLVEQMIASIQSFDPDSVVLPYLLSGGTDNKALSTLGIKGYGFAPLKLPNDLNFAKLFHGVDERVPLDALVFGKQVLLDLMRKY